MHEFRSQIWDLRLHTKKRRYEMSTTLTGELCGLDTKDTHELGRIPRKYDYSVKASGGGTLRFKVDHFTGDQIGVGADNVPGRWLTIEERIKIESGHTTTGSFTLPAMGVAADGEATMRLIF